MGYDLLIQRIRRKCLAADDGAEGGWILLQFARHHISKLDFIFSAVVKLQADGTGLGWKPGRKARAS